MGSEGKKRVLFATSETGSWIDQDEKLLRDTFHVTRVFLSLKQPEPFRWIRALLDNDVLVVWFASFAAAPLLVLARFLGIRVVIIAGGYDVARYPRLKHGAFQKNWLSQRIRRWLFQIGNCVLVVSESSREEALKNARISPERIRLIPLGFDPPLPISALPTWENRASQGVYISSATAAKFELKGLDQLLRVARCCPELSFQHIGHLDTESLERIRGELPPNLRLVGPLTFNSPEFLSIIVQSRFILQLSAYESFGAAVVDAACLGCFPITSDAYALPELTRHFGQSVPYGDVDAVAEVMRRQQKLDVDTRALASSFRQKYSAACRQNLLVETLNTLLSQP